MGIGTVATMIATVLLMLFLAPAAHAAAPLNVLGASVQSTTVVKVVFSAKVDAGAEDVAHYAISSAAVLLARRADSDYAVLLTMTPQLNAVVYDVTVDGVRGAKGGTMPGPQTMRFIGTVLGENSVVVGHDDFNRPSGLLVGDNPYSGPWALRHVNPGNAIALVESPALLGGFGDRALWSQVNNTDGEADNAAVLHAISGTEYYTSAYVRIPSGQGWESGHAVGLLRLNQGEWLAHARISAHAESATAFSLKVDFKSTDNNYYGEQLVAQGVSFDAWHWFQLRVRNSTAPGGPGIVQVWVDGRLRYAQDTHYVSEQPMTYAEVGIMHNATTPTGPSSTTITDAVRMGTTYQLPSIVTDHTSPNATLAEPAAGQTLRGPVTVRATATDDVDVQRLEFLVDGALLVTDDVAPFSTALDTTQLADGAHSLTVRAYDTSGNSALSAATAVTVDNAQATVTVSGAAPSPFTPNGDGVDDTVALSYSTVEPTLQRVTVTTLGGTTVATPLDWTLRAAGPQAVPWDGRKTDGSLALEADYRMRVEVRDLVSPALPPANGQATVTLLRTLGSVAVAPSPFSPNADGVRDSVTTSYTLLGTATTSVVVTDPAGATVRTLRAPAAQAAGSYEVVWSGADDDGATAPDGDHTIVVSAVTAAGTTTEPRSVRLDTGLPQTSQDPGPAVWHTAAVDVSLSADDALSSVVGTEFDLDGAGWQAYTGSISVAGDGVHTLRYRSTDEAGNAEPARDGAVKIDGTAPVTSQDGADGLWQNGAVTVTFSAADDPPGGLEGAQTSGVAATEFRVDGHRWQVDVGGGAVIAAPADGSNDGVHVVEYRSTDVAGNLEQTRNAEVGIDTQGPDVADTNDDLWHLGEYTLSLSAADVMAGMDGGLAGTEFSRDDGETWQPGVELLYRTWKRGGGSGAHVLLYRALDALGNVSAVGSTTVLMDARPPRTTDDAPRDETGAPVPQASDTTVHLTATDPLSGVATTWYSLDGSDWQAGAEVAIPAPSDGSNDGVHWIAYYSVDAAGNAEYVRWCAVTIDALP